MIFDAKISATQFKMKYVCDFITATIDFIYSHHFLFAPSFAYVRLHFNWAQRCWLRLKWTSWNSIDCEYYIYYYCSCSRGSNCTHEIIYDSFLEFENLLKIVISMKLMRMKCEMQRARPQSHTLVKLHVSFKIFKNKLFVVQIFEIWIFNGWDCKWTQNLAFNEF